MYTKDLNLKTLIDVLSGKEIDYIDKYSIGICAFLLVNMPSIKLFTGPYLIVNVLLLVFLLAAATYRVTSYLKYNQANLKTAQSLISQDPSFKVHFSIGLLVLCLIIILPEVLGIRSAASLYVYYSLGMIYLLIAVTTVIISSHKHDVVSFVCCQAVWGVVISLTYMSGVLTYSEDLEQHFNTVALPITLGLLILYSLIISKTIWGYPKILVILFSVMVVKIFSLLLLGSRIAVLGGVISAMIITLLYVYYEGWGWKKFAGTAILSSTLGGAIATAAYSLNLFPTEYTSRIERLLLATSEEPRVRVYGSAIEYILANPVGYGLGEFNEVLYTEYPHNLFLHAAFSGGWIAAVFLAVILFGMLYLVHAQVARLQTWEIVCIYTAIIHLLFVFSLSYSITHSYMLLIPIALGINYSREYKFVKA